MVQGNIDSQKPHRERLLFPQERYLIRLSKPLQRKHKIQEKTLILDFFTLIICGRFLYFLNIK